MNSETMAGKRGTLIAYIVLGECDLEYSGMTLIARHNNPLVCGYYELINLV